VFSFCFTGPFFSEIASNYKLEQLRQNCHTLKEILFQILSSHGPGKNYLPPNPVWRHFNPEHSMHQGLQSIVPLHMNQYRSRWWAIIKIT